MTFWSNHGHLEHQFSEVEFRIFLSGLEVLLCIYIPVGVTNNPGDLSTFKVNRRKHPPFLEIYGSVRQVSDLYGRIIICV